MLGLEHQPGSAANVKRGELQSVTSFKNYVFFFSHHLLKKVRPLIRLKLYVNILQIEILIIS